MNSDSEALLKVEDLGLSFKTSEGTIKALEDVNVEIKKREIFGLVGETGCGKTVTALTIMRLLPENARIVRGRVLFHHKDLLSETEEEVAKIRGKKISMIFQDPASSLNPTFSIGDQIEAVLNAHGNFEHRTQLREKAVEQLRLTGLADPEAVLKMYPHELSGGMQQRVMIGIALCSGPDLLIADEPTTALDVTIQAQILSLLLDLRRTLGVSIMLITHNLGIVAETCDRVAVMYAGSIAEMGETRQIFRNPLHPYTQGLLASLPTKRVRGRQLYRIPGSVPSLLHPPSGCKFHPRCPYAMGVCNVVVPTRLPTELDHEVACHLYP